MIIHYDLFAGIGGFSLALDRVYGKENTKHIFVENDIFCTAVLKKHWPEGDFWGDIREFIADTEKQGLERYNWNESKKQGTSNPTKRNEQVFLTGGFPCQPFSQAGRRKGTDDNRYLWPQMFRAIQLVKPQWVIAENVYGFITWNEGMVLQQVCADLESEGYEVQPLVIPAVSLNAPHRRDRVWIAAYSKPAGTRSEDRTITNEGRRTSEDRRKGIRQRDGEIGTSGITPTDSNAPDPKSRNPRKQTEQEGREDTGGGNQTAQNPLGKRSGRWSEDRRQVLERQGTEVQDQRPSWESNWVEVAAELCGVDAGLPCWVDGVAYSAPRHRKERLKMLGNAIVPRVAEQLLQAIKSS